MQHKPSIAEIRIDLGTQPRVHIDYDLVKEYAEAIHEGAEFPPIVVFYDGADFILADGFHRYHAYAAVATRHFTARCVTINTGSKRDAQLYACGANVAHGLRRTNEDKRKTVDFMMADAEWAKWSNRKIAKHAGVSPQLVDKARKSLDSLARRNAKKKAGRASGHNGQIEVKPGQRLVERGSQTYHMKVRPEPDDGPPVDAEGQPVTEARIARVFADPIFDEFERSMNDWRSRLGREIDNLALAHLAVPAVQRSLKDLYDTVKAARPYTITPASCDRKWRDIGFLTKRQYGNLPKEKCHEGAEAS